MHACNAVLILMNLFGIIILNMLVRQNRLFSTIVNVLGSIICLLQLIYTEGNKFSNF